MDENLYQAKKRSAPRPPKGDRLTMDIFTGEPFGAPSRPQKLSKGAKALLEYIVAHEPVQAVSLAAHAPAGAGSAKACVDELRRKKLIVDRLPGNIGTSIDLVTVSTEEGRAWLRRDRDEAKPEPAAPPAADPAQQDILSPQEAQARADQGMRAAFDHQTEEWQRWALARVRLALKKLHELTVDDVWVEIGREPRSHSEGSAMGAVMREAGRRGWCRKIPGRAVRSQRPANHGALRPVWQSLIVEVRHG